MKYCNLIYVDKNNTYDKVCTTCGKKISNKFTIEQTFSICSFKNKEVEKESEAPTMPPIKEQVFNFLSAIKDFVENPLFVTKKEYEERLKICNECQFKVNNSCRKCGCNLSIKARGKAFHCPDKKWPGDK